MKRILLLALCALLLLPFAACAKTPETPTNPQGTKDVPPTAPNPRVRFEMQDGSYFIVELLPDYAPKTVANFVKLVGEGFYNGLTFHRVVSGFMIQGGDPNGLGNGSSAEKIPGEFAQNGFTQNTLSHTRGVISMARANAPDSASCQFFIVHDDAARTSLDGRYAAFGRVVEGMETIDAIAALPVTAQPLGGERSRPIDPPVIKTAALLE